MSDVIKKATREGYGQALVELGEKYPNMVVLDKMESMLERFACMDSQVAVTPASTARSASLKFSFASHF